VKYSVDKHTPKDARWNFQLIGVWVCRLKSSQQKVLMRNKFGFWDLASPDAIAQLEEK
jgi:hypothetical protein